jgi:adenylate cyclase
MTPPPRSRRPNQSPRLTPERQVQSHYSLASMLEIERKYLLNGVPAFSPDVQKLRIEQGYLPPPDCGRLRKIVRSDGSVVHTYARKTGRGLMREEIEHQIDEKDFQAQWPRTTGRRLSKTRFCVPEGNLMWEIDVFDDLELVLAELELPGAETHVSIPAWLKRHIVREVTDDPRLTNAWIAEHGVPRLA